MKGHIRLSGLLLKYSPQITQITQITQIMSDERTYKIIGAAIEVQSADYPDEIEKDKGISLGRRRLRRNERPKNL